MKMKFLEVVRKEADATNYALSSKLRDLGVNITVSGVDAYERKNSQSMRLDVLAGLRKLSGLSWNELGKLIDEEFLTGKD